MTTVGAHEAETDLRRLLDRAEAGETTIITTHGREVARLVPPGPSSADTAGVIAGLREARRGTGLNDSTVLAMIDGGRR